MSDREPREGSEPLTYTDEADSDYIDYMEPESLREAKMALHQHGDSVPGCGGCERLDAIVRAARSEASHPDCGQQCACYDRGHDQGCDDCHD